MRREGGFALIIVLWTVVLLSLLVSLFATTGRVEVEAARNLRANASVQAAVDGALHETVFRLLQGGWHPDGVDHVLSTADTEITISIQNEKWKVNPNYATPAKLLRLFSVTGIPSTTAQSLSRSVIDWRARLSPAGVDANTAAYRAAGLRYGPPGKNFASLDELGLVLGMTKEWLSRLQPFLSVYQEEDAFDGAAPLFDSGTANSLREGWQVGLNGQTLVAKLQATGIGPARSIFTRQAIVGFRAEKTAGMPPFRILTWDPAS